MLVARTIVDRFLMVRHIRTSPTGLPAQPNTVLGEAELPTVENQELETGQSESLERKISGHAAQDYVLCQQ